VEFAPVWKDSRPTLFAHEAWMTVRGPGSAARHKRRLRIWVLALQIVGAVLALQAAVLAVLSVVAARRKRRSSARSFPHLELPPVQVAGNTLQLYCFGRDLYDAMLDAIDEAQESIFIETFIWKGDALGKEFRDRLARKAEQGVLVCVIFDRFGNLVVPHSFKASFPPGIKVLEYTALLHPWHFFDPRRYALDHRKLLVVDGRRAFIGGYNIGQLYSTKWRDTHLGIEGPEAADLAQEFMDFWDRNQTKDLQLGLHFPRRLDPIINVHTNDAARLVFPIRDLYIRAIERAQHHIYITNAYFVPDRVLLNAMIEAARRGVDVQVLVPWMSNHIAADWAARGYFATCLAAGIRIFAYRDTMIHAKTCTIDGRWSTLGTANLDRLSEVGNHEINVEIYDEAFAQQMERLFACDKTNSFELTAQSWAARPWYVKLSEIILSPLRPAL
jgi:cardiolipin synthase A/B